MRFFRVIRNLWPVRVRVDLPNRMSLATDQKGRRYGAYFWLMVSFGGLHFRIFPKHARRVFAGIYLREAWKGAV